MTARHIDSGSGKCPWCGETVYLDDCDVLGADDADCFFCCDCGREFRVTDEGALRVQPKKLDAPRAGLFAGEQA